MQTVFNLFQHVQSNKDSLIKVERFKGREMIKIWKLVNFREGNSCRWVRSTDKEYGNFPFSHDIILKQNYIVIFTSLSLINICQNYIGLDCINVSLDPQCIVSQEDFQHKIVIWSILLPLLSLHTSRAGKRKQELWELSINSEAAV